MKCENSYSGTAMEDLLYNDPVVLLNGDCRRATSKDLSEGLELYHVISPACEGEDVLLAGKDTKFYIDN
jgi:hypothetical protein